MSAENSPTLGEFLRQEREQRGITIEQVASATKIAVRLLHSLESDEYVDLPAKPFVRGFVVSYARFIGIDAKEVLTRFGAFIDKKAHDRPTRDAGHSGYAFEKRNGDQSRTVLWVVMAVFLVFGGTAFLILKPSLNRHKRSHLDKLRAAHPPTASASPQVMLATGTLPSPGPKTAQVGPSPSPLTPPVPAGTVAQAESAPPNKEDPLNSGLDLKLSEIRYKVIFKAVDDVWVRFKVDGKKPMKFILRKDRILVLRAKEGMRFQTSDPKSIRFTALGSAAKLMTDEKKAVMKKGDLTLFFPAELSETIQEPFSGAPVLHRAPVPASPRSTSLSTPKE